MQEGELSFCRDPGAFSQPGCQGESGYPAGTVESTEPSSNSVSSQGAPGAGLGVVSALFLLCSLQPCPAIISQGLELFPLEMILTPITLLAPALARLGSGGPQLASQSWKRFSLGSNHSPNPGESWRGGGRETGRKTFPSLPPPPPDAPSESSNLKAQSPAAGMGFGVHPVLEKG